VPREFLAGVPVADSKIKVKSPPSIWCAREYAIVSERCARFRGKDWRRGRSRGASLLTKNQRRSLAVSAARQPLVCAAWRRSLLGFRGKPVRAEGGLYRCVGERKSERKRPIDRTRFSRPRLILSETWGRKDDTGSDAIVGPTCQREKRRERRTGSGEREKWVVGCLRSRAGFCPRGLLLFSYFLSLFFSVFF
jgi:hypothetical protein